MLVLFVLIPYHTNIKVFSMGTGEFKHFYKIKAVRFVSNRAACV